MQKIEGSNPINRFFGAPLLGRAFTSSGFGYEDGAGGLWRRVSVVR